ncbi:hypothetical protein CERZMDRAFT_52446 [Cercospora zeae-maydis SCOH1-5]|uniref:histidine kinase n=1 Tax=Cercospora zeae-maydis SCOH1-5 TaxID=717836 RepID=A0A6A6F0L2_9PEZI|nr:hypothetical protein CERZMDRAFT_52446 [Cercospora zeae-maydis SCOH1-5]
MNSSLPSTDTSQDHSEHDDAEPTPTEPPARPAAQQWASGARPQLVRSPPGRLAELGQDADDEKQSETESTDSSFNDESVVREGVAVDAVPNAAAGGVKGKSRASASPRSQGNLAELKDALKRAQARPRHSYGASSTSSTIKRVSPIKEETNNDSPTASINSVLASNNPVPTASTESTESARTLRGSVPPTPGGNVPLRTPSYPFPYVPGTPRSWSQTFHQPFTALSPTVTNQRLSEGETPSTRSNFSVISGGNTPAANSAFLPPGMQLDGNEDPRYPTPNLYDLVLQLNTEPGIEQWWATVTNIVHDNFKAERASLVQPLDPNDIENVPWGQKATFSMNGREDFVPPSAVEQPHGLGLSRPDIKVREPSNETVSDVRPQKLHPERLRPRLEARHSYAGHGREVREPNWGYHEYEQHPPSPWTQSPAPSPAIQADEEINPFFASDDQLLDESFNPAVSPKDYSQYDQVEAIGIDHASTIIHIPLIHPTLSQSMQALRMTTSNQDNRPSSQRTHTAEFDRKAPIAILSLLTATVPYPANLVNALRLLGPHLATSFQNAQQFSSTHMQAVHIRHRRTTSGRRANLAPMTIEPASLEDIVNAELEEVPGSISGSITSPSDYSGRSRISPSGSLVGTPGWDPATHGWTASRSRGGTPAFTGSEMVDNYFDAKKRSGQRSGSNASNTTTGPGKSGSKSSDSQEEAPLSRGERKARAASTGKLGKSPLLPPTSEANPIRSQSKAHSLLHSYGADFETTYGGLPASTPNDVRGAGHGRKGSSSEDMPPPSERLLRTIIDSVPVQIFTAQPETGNLSWVNSKFLIYRGQDPTTVLKDPWAAIHPQDRHEFLPAWQRSLRTNQQLQQKVRLKRFDGSYRWFYVRAAPLKDKRQKVVHWIGTLMDFHEQQIAEMNASRQQETAASEAKYRALANSSPQIVFAVNKTRGVTFCNSQWLQYSGQTEAQALGAGFMEHVHPEDLVKCKLPSFDAETREPNVPTTLPMDPKRSVSASEVSTSGSSETEKPPSNSPSDASSLSPIQPLPQRKLSQLATSGILKVSRDPDGRPSYSTEVRLKNRDGEFRWHLVRVLVAEPLLQHENEEETWYGTCTDINDHKDLERDLKNTMDAKSRFLSNMSHEIRTPLNGITGMVNFLIDSSLTAEQMEHVNIIRASTEGLRGLINDILDLSKAEAGMIQLNMDWVYVRALIEEVNDLTSAMAIDKGLELNYIVDEDVPPQIKGDRFRIRQILLNVVGNAIKFTQTGEVFIRCSTYQAENRLLKEEMLIKFDVIDTGQGFTDKDADSLFKRFSQIDGSSTRQHGGTGLGLVISKQLAQLHGGDMSAKSVPGKGSTFTFYIRTTLPSEDDKPPMPIPTPGVSPANVPILPTSPGPAAVAMFLDPNARLSPKFAGEVTQTPPQIPPMSDAGTESPSISSAKATVQHIDKTLPGNVPHQITARESLEDCQKLLVGPDPVIFTHIVVVLQDVHEIISLMDQVLAADNPRTSIVLITDLAQRRKIMEQAPRHDCDQLAAARKLRVVFKPLKPSRFGLIFDPQKEREMSLDRNQDSAQQVAVNQKQVFEELARRLGNKDKRVLLVEDNKVNQMVILKFLSKVSIKVDTVMDGVQCTEKVFANPPNHYSIILCDLHMPNKDGYQTCKEIRLWEKQNQYAHLPVIALSANVLGDVYQKCVEAGFNSYMTKPVDFKELSQVLMTFMDPSDPSKPHAFMKLKHGQHSHKSKDPSREGRSKEKTKKLTQ